MAQLSVFILLPSVLIVVNSAPLTCYSRVLTMRNKINNKIERLQSEPFAKRCTSQLPDLYIDVHDSCMVSKMRDYLLAVENLTDRRCQYTLDSTVRLVRRLFIIMAKFCQAEPAFWTNKCSLL
ncbi:cytokine-like protein 1 [Callorhinchus milii]|uniref:Cytokine-like protein 1 n=1 Tax=Callorhinchus milii TaxID=7868 RepID=V9LBQ6_CALMI|nr:cytokine-like protein 1 [Callorhinchus milii]